MSTALGSGTLQDRFAIGRRLATGGMGALYECVDRRSGERRALKLMLSELASEPSLRARFEREARIVVGLRHEHIVGALEAGVDEATQTPFIVMELLRGEDLADMLARRGRLTRAEAVTLLAQAARALDATHEAGVVHRDLKPENLFVVPRDDGSPCLKILDFGVAKIMSEAFQTLRRTESVGTPPYMAPEQIQGDGAIGPRADLYALAHVAFTLLTGSAYWDDEQRAASSLAMFLCRVAAGSTEIATARAARRGVTLPAAFDAWFDRATAVSPAARFPSAVAMIAHLARVLGHEVSGSERRPERHPEADGATSAAAAFSAVLRRGRAARALRPPLRADIVEREASAATLPWGATHAASPLREALAAIARSLGCGER